MSAGGKESTAEILLVECSRRAAKQIDWDAVDADGIKQLCAWSELVSFE